MPQLLEAGAIERRKRGQIDRRQRAWLRSGCARHFAYKQIGSILAADARTSLTVFKGAPTVCKKAVPVVIEEL